MPRYPRKAYCLDKGEPQTKENSQNKIEEQEKEKLLEESNDEKTMTLNQHCDTSPDNFVCSKCDYKTTKFLEWFYHRRCHPSGTFIEKRFATTIYNTDDLMK